MIKKCLLLLILAMDIFVFLAVGFWGLANAFVPESKLAHLNSGHVTLFTVFYVLSSFAITRMLKKKR